MIYFKKSNLKMRKLLVIMLATLFLPLVTLASDIESKPPDLSKMSDQELLDFYIKNPDFWKKQLEIDYSKYLSGSYIVFRGELYGSGNTPIKDYPINFRVDGEMYSYVTNDKWIFNLEMKDDVIKEGIIKKADKEYIIRVNLWDAYIDTRKLWSELLAKKIYHFKITKNNNTYSLKNLYNTGFTQWSDGFVNNIDIEYTYSIFWIQWVWLYLLFGMLWFLILFFVFQWKFQAKG